MLLLATPVLLDPNFADTVVLMLDVGDEGALGVVLNRPTGLAVSEVLSDWGDVVAEPEVLFQGGPVETEGALAVALRSSTDGEAVGFREVAGPARAARPRHPRRAGHRLARRAADLRRATPAGAAASCEQEIAEGHWYVVPGRGEDVFRSDSRELWRDVLRRQPGDLAMHSTRPVDPDLN